MNLGDLATVIEGEVVAIAVTFASRLSVGETLAGATVASMAVWPYSPVQDANAANLVLGTPWISGNSVYALCGGFGTAGFKPGVVYSLFATVTTSLGRTLIEYGQITCDPVIPAVTSSGGNLPNNVAIIMVNTTASASAVYALDAAGLTLTLPPAWASNGGPVTVSDVFGQGGTIAGPVLNWPSGVTSQALGPFGSENFVWSSQLNGWVAI
jgi:hypothetical protein